MDTPKEPSTSCIPSEKNSLLICEVRKFPSLYDTSDPNYYVLAERNKAWLQVAENCSEPADLCHLRWKSLRKRYAKERRRFPEILQGRRRPWALFPKMSFLTPPNSKTKIRPLKARRKSEPIKVISKPVQSFKHTVSDDDMLIVDDNDEIVQTVKSLEMSGEEDEYIYETLDDPDSALEMMKDKEPPKVKPTAIRSGGPVVPMPQSTIPASTTFRPSRVRKLTPKMQNSIIAKKLKQAQQILQQSNAPNNNNNNNNNNKKATTLQKVMIANNKTPHLLESPSPTSNSAQDKAVLYQDRTTRHVATVNPNIIRVEKLGDKGNMSPPADISSETVLNKRSNEASSTDGNRPFKVFKLKGRNPIIFSPDKLPDIQSFLKSEASSPTKEGTDMKPPMIKVKSVDNLNSQNSSFSSESGESNNLDIIHSVGLMRKSSAEKTVSTERTSQNFSRFYSWNRPHSKTSNKQTATEKIQADSQTNDYEIEETWNDIKEENIDDYEPWSTPQEPELYRHEEPVNTSSDHQQKVNIWNKVSEAKLELIGFQRRLLEEQHRKNMEYMKREHELKMTLLKAEIDLKRKQLNIML